MTMALTRQRFPDSRTLRNAHCRRGSDRVACVSHNMNTAASQTRGLFQTNRGPWRKPLRAGIGTCLVALNLLELLL